MFTWMTDFPECDLKLPNKKYTGSDFVLYSKTPYLCEVRIRGRSDLVGFAKLYPYLDKKGPYWKSKQKHTYSHVEIEKFYEYYVKRWMPWTLAPEELQLMVGAKK